MEIYLIRHGETEWNKLKKGQGQEADIPLNDTGREQARKTGEYLKKYRTESGEFDCIWSSPMKRTKESAEIISKIIDFRGEIYFDDVLKERKHGKLSGLPKSDPLIQKFIEEKIKLTPEDPIERIIQRDKITDELNKKFDVGMENEEELETRSQKIIDNIKKSNCKKLIIIGHGGFLLAMIRKIFNISQVPEGNWSCGENCWISYLTYDKNTNFRLISPPGTEHLGLIK